jgi:hypothetical protein
MSMLFIRPQQLAFNTVYCLIKLLNRTTDKTIKPNITKVLAGER